MAVSYGSNTMGIHVKLIHGLTIMFVKELFLGLMTLLLLTSIRMENWKS